MTYVVTQACCNDASCMSVCPVNCIHPTPGEPDFGHTEMVYVDPRSCIDCGACADACPVSAIKPLNLLTGNEQVFIDLNSAFYETRGVETSWQPVTFPTVGSKDDRPLRIAVVGTGPAASYAARELLTTTTAEVSMIDRLPVTGGLVRAGVAPDHQDTKGLADMFAWTYANPRTTMYLNVTVGVDVSHEELMSSHDAVVYGVGANTDRRLDVPGEDLPGVLGSPAVVGWYNGHTDIAADAVALRTDRVVVVGNGNVALDIARLLLSDPASLTATDMADHALIALGQSPVREVVLLGRRGPDAAAFTRPELLMMPAGIDVVIADDSRTAGEIAAADPGSKAALLSSFSQIAMDWDAAPPDGKRIVLAFHQRVEEVLGSDTVEAVRISPTEQIDGTGASVIPTGLLIRSTGHRGSPLTGLPFDPSTSTIPHRSGRVVDPATGEPVAGAYVVGWIKRGAFGGIGANRTDAQETVSTLLADARSGALARPPLPARTLGRILRRRGVDVVGARRMKAIEAAERARGAARSGPRAKFTTVEEMLALRHRRP